MSGPGSERAKSGAGHQGPERTPSFSPTRKDRLSPREIIVFAAVFAVFSAVVTLFTTREFLLAGIALGGVFVIALVVLVILVLGFKDPDLTKSGDLDDLDDLHSLDDFDRRDDGDAGRG